MEQWSLLCVSGGAEKLVSVALGAIVASIKNSNLVYERPLYAQCTSVVASSNYGCLISVQRDFALQRGVAKRARHAEGVWSEGGALLVNNNNGCTFQINA